MKSKVKPKVSIIIRTKNEEKYIKLCLQKIKQQSFKNFEIIIVDNYSNDLTVKKAKEFTKKIIKIKNFIPGKAINEGIKLAKGNIIVVLSAHCLPVNNKWLSNLIKGLKDKNVAGIYGRQEPMKYTSDIDKRDLLTVFGLDKKIQIKDTFFHNANSAFRKETWKKIPFNEKITNIEDRLWGEKVISMGFKIIYEPSASVYHFHGIHQNLNKKRAKNVVKILESLDNFKKEDNSVNYKDLKILALIPVRGKSLNFLGKPLIKKTIEDAKKSKFITDVVVSTDNKTTTKLAKLYGAKVPFIRPSSLSRPSIKALDVLSYSIKNLEKKKNYYDLVVVLANSYPFRSEDLIDKMIKRFLEEGLDTLIASVKESRGIWLSDNDEVNLINDPSTPRHLKKKHAFITLFGLCCVTHPSILREKNIFKKDYTIYKTNDVFDAVDINSLKKSQMLEKTLKKIKLN
jgi:CMP-N-acetylneuraminic acid synthetase